MNPHADSQDGRNMPLSPEPRYSFSDVSRKYESLQHIKYYLDQKSADIGKELDNLKKILDGFLALK